jgi:hypothetical protein
LQPTTQTRTTVRWLHVVFEDSVVDFVDVRLLRCRNYIPTFQHSNDIVLLFGQALRLAVPKDFIQLLLASIATAVNACCFAEPINGCLDACGGCDLLYGIA